MKAVCAEKSTWGQPSAALAFSAENGYVPDGADAPPYISISVNVDGETAEQFTKGASYTLTIAPTEE
jgi:hypothetical protein